VPADRALLERVLSSSGAERSPVAPASSYLGELFGALQRAMVAAMVAGAKWLHLAPWMLWGIAGVLAALAALLILRAIVSRVRRRPAAEPKAIATTASAPDLPRDAAGWRAELERRLAGGRTREALEALWWWLARSLAGAGAEPDWTSRDLVARSRRKDLRDLVRRLDAFTYGPRPPEVAELRGLLDRLEEALA
jgi:hypothetical protein